MLLSGVPLKEHRVPVYPCATECWVQVFLLRVHDIRMAHVYACTLSRYRATVALTRARAQTQTRAHHRMEVDGDGSGDLPMFSTLASGNVEKDGTGEAGGARGAGGAGADGDVAGSVNGSNKGEKEGIDPPSSPRSGLPMLGGKYSPKYSLQPLQIPNCPGTLTFENFRQERALAVGPSCGEGLATEVQSLRTGGVGPCTLKLVLGAERDPVVGRGPGGGGRAGGGEF